MPSTYTIHTYSLQFVPSVRQSMAGSLKQSIRLYHPYDVKPPTCNIRRRMIQLKAFDTTFHLYHLYDVLSSIYTICLNLGKLMHSKKLFWTLDAISLKFSSPTHFAFLLTKFVSCMQICLCIYQRIKENSSIFRTRKNTFKF